MCEAYHALTGQSSEFRNAALEAGPTLLDSLLKKANASEREFDEVSRSYNTQILVMHTGDGIRATRVWVTL